MAPTHSSLSDEEMRSRISVLISLGTPFENIIKTHPDRQPRVSSRLVAKRRNESGFKMLGAFAVGSPGGGFNDCEFRSEAL